MEKVKKHGGRRAGAGRKKGGRYGEATKAMRVPVSAIEHIEAFLERINYLQLHEIGKVITHREMCWILCRLICRLLWRSSLNAVPAGVPMTMDTHIDMSLDLNHHFIEHPSTTFYVRVTGLSMVEVGIFPDDILIVDRAIEPRHNKIVIASVDGDMTVKRLFVKMAVLNYIQKILNLKLCLLLT